MNKTQNENNDNGEAERSGSVEQSYVMTKEEYAAAEKLAGETLANLKDTDGKVADTTGTPLFKKIVYGIGVAFAIFGLSTNSFLQMDLMKKGGIFLSFVLALSFLLYPTKIKGRRIYAVDVILAILGMSVGLYTYFRTDSFQTGVLEMTAVDLFMSILAFVLVILATRKVVGNALAILPLLFTCYALFGNMIPGAFGHYGFSYERFFMRMYMVSEGVYGLCTQIASSYIFLFILFGAVLERSGVGQFFTDSANRIAGASAGGPAKVAVISSGLMGMISGSAAANVATTGAFTIPMMKKEGFANKFAGAVEATASTGGLIMPPVMGSAAYLMVQYLNVPYSRIMLAALIPAFLYYLSCFFWVHFEALRIGHRGKDRKLIPKLADLKHRIWLLLPLAGIIFGMVLGYTPIFAALFGMALCLFAGLIQKPENRLSLRKIVDGFSNGSKSALTASIACVAAGIIVGVCSMTGIGQILTYNIVAISGGSLFFALILTAFSCLLLSMGLPATACYVLVATIVAPALIEMGVAPIAAHMFVFYFASLSNVTPPVAVASYTAAGLADAKPFEVAWQAMKIALPGFIVPFLFAYNPIILFENAEPIHLIIVIITSVTGVIFMAIAGAGRSFDKIKMPLRLSYIISALLLIDPGYVTDIIGMVLITATFMLDWIIFKKNKEKKPSNIA